MAGSRRSAVCRWGRVVHPSPLVWEMSPVNAPPVTAVKTPLGGGHCGPAAAAFLPARVDTGGFFIVPIGLDINSALRADRVKCRDEVTAGRPGSGAEWGPSPSAAGAITG